MILIKFGVIMIITIISPIQIMIEKLEYFNKIKKISHYIIDFIIYIYNFFYITILKFIQKFILIFRY